MNRPCRIHFHDDSLVCIDRLGLASYSLLAQNAFYIDFNPQVLRTRVGGKDDDPIDFPLDSVSHIEWFYGDDVPEPLVPWEQPAPRSPDSRRN
jgi:hypothetical protein